MRFKQPVDHAGFFTAFFGVSPDELAAKTYDDLARLIHPDDLDLYQKITCVGTRNGRFISMNTTA